MKNLCPFVFLAWILSSCAPGEAGNSRTPLHHITGEAQGTTYSIKYLGGDTLRIEKAAIDSILDAIDQSLSTWVDHSTISRFNRADTITIDDPHFIAIFEMGKELSALTGGAFHPMVAPLVRAWGFGPEGGQVKDNLDVDSLMRLVTWDIEVTPIAPSEPSGGGVDTPPGALLFAKAKGVEIDVNSYAQGYAVDVLVDYLLDRGVQDMMVEVGGELAARGLNAEGEAWRIGIDKPVDLEAVRELQAAVALIDAAMATSGTYRKFYEKDGKKYSHTIDPATGHPVAHNLLSVTVMAPNATHADAMATAFLVMGVEGTKAFLAAHPELHLEVFLIYDVEAEGLATYTSPGWKERVEEL